MRDGFGRTISYLRLSVTDRCDFRCRYCLPRSHRGFATADDWLTPSEIAHIVRLFVGLGVEHVRLTGGEPLVRRELPQIATAVASLPGIRDLSLSTNASRLAGRAEALRRAGVTRLNISLDSLDATRFHAITGGRLDRVLSGIAAARRAGFAPIKINTVAMRGINDDEFEDLVEFCMAHGLALRFIETMPVGLAGQEAQSRYLPLTEVERTLRRRFTLRPAAMQGSGPARYYQVDDSDLLIGFITPQSQHFCATCNRVRLSVRGDLFLCLGQEHRVPLGEQLRAGASDAALRKAIVDGIARKPRQHEFDSAPIKIGRPMSALGG
jgi:cyclic pyranopterin phosphate synthase